MTVERQAIEPCPTVRDDLVEVLCLRPRDNSNRPIPGKLIGFWRSRADWREPEAGGVYWRAAQNTQDTLNEETGKVEQRSRRYLSESDLAPYGGSRVAYFQAELARGLDKAQAHSELPWPGDHLDPSMPQDERERVASLLDDAPIVANYRGCSNDRINPENCKGNGSGERALAGWIWPTGLSHYVRAYGLVLPTEMITDLRDA